MVFFQEAEQRRLDVRKYSVPQRRINLWNSLPTDCAHCNDYLLNIKKDTLRNTIGLQIWQYYSIFLNVSKLARVGNSWACDYINKS